MVATHTNFSPPHVTADGRSDLPESLIWGGGAIWGGGYSSTIDLSTYLLVGHPVGRTVALAADIPLWW